MGEELDRSATGCNLGVQTLRQRGAYFQRQPGLELRILEPTLRERLLARRRKHIRCVASACGLGAQVRVMECCLPCTSRLVNAPERVLGPRHVFSRFGTTGAVDVDEPAFDIGCTCSPALR